MKILIFLSIGWLARFEEQAGSLAARHRADNHERFFPGSDWRRDFRACRFVRQVLFAGKEADERTAPQGSMIPNRSAQYRVASLDCVEHRADCDRTLNFDLHLGVSFRQVAQVVREGDTDHGTGSSQCLDFNTQNRREIVNYGTPIVAAVW